MAGQTYYQILGIKTDASEQQIRKAYRDLAKKYHPDRVQDEESKLKAEAYFSAITEAFNVLTDKEKKAPYDEKMRSQSASKESEQAKEAKIFFRHGVAKYNQKNYDEAVRFFKAAIHYDGSVASYYAHLAMALAKTKQLGESIRHIEKAIEMESYNPRYLRIAGQYMIEAGMVTRARRMFERAVKWDPEDKVSKDELVKITGKSQGKLGNLISKLFRKS